MLLKFNSVVLVLVTIIAIAHSKLSPRLEKNNNKNKHGSVLRNKENEEKDTADDKEITAKPPNIIFILADDLGWDDVSFHGSDQIMTPNIDILAYEGVVLNNYYTDSLGTPSRSALFTGKYPLTLGTQSVSITASEDRGLPITEKLLPQYLKDLGYATHLVGKWQLGKSRKRYWPTNRGFDTFYGFLDGSVDYFTYNHIEAVNSTELCGLELYENLRPIESTKGHITDLLTNRAIDSEYEINESFISARDGGLHYRDISHVINEHQKSQPLYLHISHAAPHAGGGLVNLQPVMDHIEKNDHIAHSARRMYAALVTHLDQSVGQVVTALADRGMMNNTIIIFASDNGAASVGETRNFGSNHPLRGTKNTPFEGAIRSPAYIWYKNITDRVSMQVFHVTDWLPTLVYAAGGIVEEEVNGKNLWQSLIDVKLIERQELLLTVDDISGWAAYREGDFKIIVGDLLSSVSDYYGNQFTDLRFEVPSYRETLLNCELFNVLRNVFDADINYDKILDKRSLLTLRLDTNVTKGACFSSKDKGCLYDLSIDPLETNDIWNESPELVRKLTFKLRTLWTHLKPRSLPKADSKANPALHNFTWSWWLEDDASLPEQLLAPLKFPLQVTMGELQYLVDLNMNSFKTKMFDFMQNMGESIVTTVSNLFNL